MCILGKKVRLRDENFDRVCEGLINNVIKL